MEPEAICAAVKRALEGTDVDETMCDYVGETVVSMLEDWPEDLDTELLEQVAPFLESFMDAEAAEAACKRLIAIIKGLDGAKSEKEPDPPKAGECVVDLKGIILAYGTRSLLQMTDLYFICGRRYALVGNNGVGKTTMMSRLAANNITGFPTHLKCIYVQHEILSDREMSVVEFVQKNVPNSGGPAQVQQALADVGFDKEMQKSSVSVLSGGWRMRLAIAQAMLKKADILLLDEPTNHLDVGAVAWLVEYLTSLQNTTVVFVSHDTRFLEAVATDIIQYENRRLVYYDGPYSDFLKKREEKEKVEAARKDMSVRLAIKSGGQPAQATSHTSQQGGGGSAQVEEDARPPPRFKFPHPGSLDVGSKVVSRTRVMMKMTDVTFKYPNTSRNVLENVSVRLTLSSRVAIMGANGAGKSTLLNLLCNELALDQSCGEVPPRDVSRRYRSLMTGTARVWGVICDCLSELGIEKFEVLPIEVWKHHNLRVAYIAQHSMHHLEEHLDTIVFEYIQRRFRDGIDEEAKEKSSTKLTEAEEAKREVRGEVEAILGRHTRGRILEYEVKYKGIRDPVWCPLSGLQYKGESVMKLVRLFDEQRLADAAGLGVRSLHKEEVISHLCDFGLQPEVTVTKISCLSGGQRSRLVLAAAMWNRPHLICLDEPTNYLDRCVYWFVLTRAPAG